ncbi:MAG: O-antigen ligase family protein, partial [Candidatus Acidiferrum sp.]
RPCSVLARKSEQLCTTAISWSIATLSLPLVVLASRRVRRVLLATVVLNIPLRVEKHFFIRQDAGDLGSLGGLQISLTNIALTVLYVAWLLRIVIQSRSSAPQRRSLSKVTFPAVLLLVFYALSLFIARDVGLGVFEVCSVLELFFLYLYISKTTNAREDVLFIVRLLLIGLLIQSLLMLAQVGGLIGDIQFFGLKARSEFPGVAGDLRISGTIGAPNAAAAYLAMMMAVALGVLLANVRLADKYLAGIGLAMATVPLIFTLSRGGWLSFLVGLAAIMIFGRRRVPWKSVGVLTVILLLLVIPFSGIIAERLSGDDNGSAASRIPLNHLAAVMIADHPLSGAGANNFAVAMEPYLAHNFSGDFLYTVHNTYLLIWAETGIGGLIAFIWLLIAIVRQGYRCWSLRDPLCAPLALGCAAAVMVFMVQINFEPTRSRAESHLIWLFAGLITAMIRMSVGPPAVPQAGAMAVRKLIPLNFGRPSTTMDRA